MTTRVAGLPRTGGSHSQHQHPPAPALDVQALVLDVAGGAAAATLMLVLTCWLLSLGGAFQPGHVEPGSASAAAHAAAAPHGAAAQH